VFTECKYNLHTAHYIILSQHFVKHSTHKKVIQVKDVDLNKICFTECTVAR
jgi:hypothetical protein